MSILYLRRISVPVRQYRVSEIVVMQTSLCLVLLLSLGGIDPTGGASRLSSMGAKMLPSFETLGKVS